MKHKAISTFRLSAITDGVFAIAMTLLVLDIKVPLSAGVTNHEEFVAALRLEAPSFIGWLISFAILCRLWITQHALLAEGEIRSRAFAGFTFLFLGAIAFIPFPTALMSEHPDQALAVIIFSCSYGIASLALGGMWYLLAERSENSTLLPFRVSSTAKHVIILMPATALLASLLALINPLWGVATWILLPFAFLAWRLKSTSHSPMESKPEA